MNKLLTKIVGVALGATMAVGVGVGVAVNNSRDVVDSQVNAATGDTAKSTVFSKTAEYFIVANQTSTDSTKWYLKGSTGDSVDANASWGVCTTDSSEAMRFTIDGNTVASGKTAIVVKSTTNYGNKPVYVAGLSTGKFKFSTTSVSIAIDGDGKIYNSTSGTYLLRHNYNSGSGGLRWYNSSTGTIAYLVEAPAASSDPEISVDKNSLEVVENDNNGGTFTVTYKNTESDFVITSSDTNEDYVWVDYTSAHGTSGSVTVNVYGLAMTSSPVTLTISQDGVTDDLEVSVTVLSDNVVTVTAAGGATTLKQGATLQLSASSSKDGETPVDTFTWSSSSESIATVSSSGLVTGVAEGDVTITATSDTYGTSGTKALSVTFSADYARAVFYDEEKLGNTGGTSATSSNVKAAFSNGDKVIDSISVTQGSIGKNGGLSFGTNSANGTITFNMKTGYALKSVTIWGATVDSGATPTAIKDNNATVFNNGGSLVSKGEKMNNNPVTWTYSNETSVTFTSVAKSTRFTIYQIDLCWAEITPTSFGLGNDTSATLMRTETKQLTPVIEPKNYNVDLGITWSSTASAYASVNNKGLITAEAVGSATISATSTYGSAQCNVTVIELTASSVTFRGNTLTTLTGTGTEELIMSGKTWTFSKVVKYAVQDLDNGNEYTKGGVKFDKDDSYFGNKDAYSFNIKKIIVVHCTTKTGVKEDGNAFTVTGSATYNGEADETLTTSTTSGIISTYTFSTARKFVKISNTSSTKYITSVTIEFDNPQETIYSVADYILGLAPERDDVIGACTLENGTYLEAKKRMALLDGTARSNFQTSNDATVTAARTRYEIWAGNNHDSSPYDGTTSISQNSRAITNGLGINTSSVAIIIVVASVIGLASICGYFLLRKRKEER